MKRRLSIFTIIGILIYVIMTITDRFIVKLEDYIYIPIAIAGIAFIFIGIIIDRRRAEK